MNEWHAKFPALADTEGGTLKLAPPPSEAAIPVATYRMQFNKQFNFTEATRYLSYLRRLGISHCYASPFLKARPGSSHGYDIVDHNTINPEIGSREDFERFVAELRKNGMGLIMDVVPNHVGIMGNNNEWWLDVLENGQTSAYASFFDIDWHPGNRALQNKILVPVLGGPYGDILEQHELKLFFDVFKGEFAIDYHQHCFPVDPQTYPFILNSQHEALKKTFAADDPVFLEYQTLENSFSKLPQRTETTEEKKEERNRDKEVFKKHLARLCADNPPVLRHIEARLDEINRSVGESSELHALLEQQVYRLAYWRVAGDEINYRRFFDVNDLAGVRVEDEQVFDATHRFILSLIAERKIQGLRIDHADGLYDPVAYYQRLCRKLSEALGIEPPPSTPPVYVVAEKIVANYEYLSSDWAIHGTTGYEYANAVNGVFIDSRAEPVLTRCYGQFIKERKDFGEVVYQAKKFVIATLLASELTVLANQLNRIAQASYKTRDYTLNALRQALTEVVACFPVYRTYINSEPPSKKDGQYIHWAVQCGRQRSRAADKTVFDFIRSVLLLEPNPMVASRDLLRFVMKLQQYTAPVMAKGYEDTALYEYHRLVSLNEVGGDPGCFGTSVNAFHHINQERLRKWPHSLLSLSTHDSKHSADVRAKLNVLSEMPRPWQEAVIRWHKLNRPHRSKARKKHITRNDEYLFYQVLIGTWPLAALTDPELERYRERIRNYMIKAIREAKQETSWVNPDEAYEQAVDDFVCRCLDVKTRSPFLTDFVHFEKQIRKPGLLNALAQTVLHLTSPGVPDLYQGSELWQFTLVDPDNRRPIDFHRHERILDEMEALLAESDGDRGPLIDALLGTMDDGRIKLFTVTLTLRFRLRHSALFQQGEYIKISVRGRHADHCLAYARKIPDDFAVIVVPRLTASLFNAGFDPPFQGFWDNTWLELPPDAPTDYREWFSRRKMAATPAEDHLQLRVRDVFNAFPFAILSAP
ncbi:malto-oligosyltrehalose synthase [Methylosarcina fibrata]|uniref:malto-oligosyltrehalose synthase n=1 Tax=Methylosarcina fibrata TaxID=105972 RepID=UPI000371CBD9|nr:malto-oligosyltrehalose synthase [Methylosarcina fibrata]